jgi:hypothetical protein
MTAVPVLATLIVLFFAALGALKVAAVPTMAERARHVGFTATSYRWIGLLELAGAWWPPSACCCSSPGRWPPTCGAGIGAGSSRRRSSPGSVSSAT